MPGKAPAALIQPAANQAANQTEEELFPESATVRLRYQWTLLDGQRVRDGTYEEFYKSGRIKDRGQFAKGKRTGLWTRFRDADGAPVMQTQTFDADRLNGPELRYFPSGRLRERTLNAAGQEQGLREKWSEDLNQSGPRLHSLVERSRLRAGEMNGVMVTMWPAGGLSGRSLYQTGQRVGPGLTWGSGGELITERAAPGPVAQPTPTDQPIAQALEGPGEGEAFVRGVLARVYPKAAPSPASAERGLVELADHYGLVDMGRLAVDRMTTQRDFASALSNRRLAGAGWYVVEVWKPAEGPTSRARAWAGVVRVEAEGIARAYAKAGAGADAGEDWLVLAKAWTEQQALDADWFWMGK
jgi:hypothetical protein